MSNPIEQNPVVKPQDMHATGGTESEITTKDMHATSEPAIDAITAKVTGKGDITTMDMHATSEPAKPTI
ncbi:hypothetical protein [Streptomyces showdoensis]|uniref:Sigma-like protein n=1 Tax=Streptomyces showdoensis TaxID=68268 RepID=A0A2P2GS46_STREW|nr:hypothetical protein [Streptomyces showdoensis]KKZ74304.1 hypothetical protein VO63_07585 [Streptomyces showdoensis]